MHAKVGGEEKEEEGAICSLFRHTDGRPSSSSSNHLSSYEMARKGGEKKKRRQTAAWWTTLTRRIRQHVPLPVPGFFSSPFPPQQPPSFLFSIGHRERSWLREWRCQSYFKWRCCWTSFGGNGRQDRWWHTRTDTKPAAHSWWRQTGGRSCNSTVIVNSRCSAIPPFAFLALDWRGCLYDTDGISPDPFPLSRHEGVDREENEAQSSVLYVCDRTG